jgi:hypothetical protein
MVTNAIEPSRNYKVPSTDNGLSEDMLRLIDAITAIGVDVKSLLADVAVRALVGHAHQISDVTALQAALDGKMSAGKAFQLQDLTDTVGIAGAANAQILKKVGVKWQPGFVDYSELTGTAPSAPDLSGYLTKDGNLFGLTDLLATRNNLGLGTAALRNAGTAANNVVLLDGSGNLPALNGSALTNIRAPITWTSFVGATGTAVDFTGIPLTANEIFVYLASVSLNDNGDIGIQLGNSGGFLATGYQSSSAILSGTVSSAVNYNTAWGLNVSAGVNALVGLVTITRVDSQIFVMSSNLVRQGAQNPGVVTSSGWLQLTGFDRLRILRLAAGTFDQGGFVVGHR